MPAIKKRRPFVIGVTGDIACGKSAVLAMLDDLGAETIDADLIYHQLIEPGTPLWSELKRHFGEKIIAVDGTIDRRVLSSIVFSNAAELAEVDRITHPAVVEAVKGVINASESAIVAVDAVKLVESGMAGYCDQVWLVVCSSETQIERLISRNGIRREDALRRIASLGNRAFLNDHADVVIENNGTHAETRSKVEAAWRELPILPS
jgi:dephospho-CoA kinase